MYLEFRDVSGRVVHWPLEQGGEPATIGRNPGSSAYSKQSTVSRNHGRIQFDGAQLYVKDLGSSNGTFVNGERTTRENVRPGDVVRFGEVFEVVVCDGEPDPAHTPKRDGRPRVSQPTNLARADADPVDSVDERKRRNAEREAEREQRRQEREQRHGSGEVAAKPELRPSSDVRPAPPRPRPEPRPEPDVRPRREPEPRPKPAEPRREPEVRPSPRGHIATGQSRVVEAVGGGRATDREYAELQRKVAALDAALADAERRSTQLEVDAKSTEQRAMRYSVELEGLSEKYRQLKEQNRVMAASLEDTREDQRKREDEAFEAERKVSDLESELNAAREKAGEATEQLSGLKVRLTQKDRQIEELQRQLDLLEYELRTQRDEMDSLQSSFNREGGDVQRLERKINLLQEVIQEKESVIEQLRIDLRDKDIEIRQVRMGVGISDLEHEKRRLLEDYHNATRRVDELQDRLDQRSREMDSVRAELDGVRKEAGERKAPVDISDHPDTKAKIREIERLQEQLDGSREDLGRAEQKLTTQIADTEAVTKLETELAIAQKRNDALAIRLETVEARVIELQAIEPEVKGTILPDGLMEELEGLADAITAARQNARLVRKYASQLEKGVGQDGDLGEAASLLYDIAVVLVQDIVEQERVVHEVQEKLAGGQAA